MSLKSFFNSRTASVTDAVCARRVKSLIGKLAAARRATARRDRRVRRLIDTIRADRAQHAAHAANQNELIDALKEELLLRPKLDLAATRDAVALEQDLATAVGMLDEFEAEACAARDAQARIADLQTQADVHRELIADLEAELALWRTSGRDAA